MSRENEYVCLGCTGTNNINELIVHDKPAHGTVFGRFEDFINLPHEEQVVYGTHLLAILQAPTTHVCLLSFVGGVELTGMPSITDVYTLSKQLDKTSRPILPEEIRDMVNQMRDNVDKRIVPFLNKMTVSYGSGMDMVHAVEWLAFCVMMEITHNVGQEYFREVSK